LFSAWKPEALRHDNLDMFTCCRAVFSGWVERKSLTCTVWRGKS